MAKDTDYIAELKEINKQTEEIENKSRKNIDNMESEYLLARKRNESQEKLEEINKRIAKEKKEEAEELAKLAQTIEILAKREARHEKEKAKAKEVNSLAKEVSDAQELARTAEARKSEEKWDGYRKGTKELLTDPVSWMKQHLLQKGLNFIELKISAKARRTRDEENKVALDKEQEAKDNLIEKAKTLAKLRSEGESAPQSSTPTEILPDSTPAGISAEILPDSTPTGSSAAILPDSEDSMGIEELIDNSSATSEKTDSVIFRLTSIEALIKAATRQDNDQWKADQRISAGEEANASKLKKGGGGGGSESGSEASDSVVEELKEKGMGFVSTTLAEAAGSGIAVGAGMAGGKAVGKFKKVGGMKGILKSVIGKFGKAGKFLMSLGSRVLMPLLTTPIGWGILAALAVGGMIFYYWDDIKAFVGKMFDKIKTYFPKMMDGISKAFKTAVGVVGKVLKFLNPLNLWSILLKAILPAEWYNSAAGWIKENLNYGDGSIEQQKEASDRKVAVTEEQQVALDKSVKDGFAATDEYSKKDRIEDLQAKVDAGTATGRDKETLKSMNSGVEYGKENKRRLKLIKHLEKENIVKYNWNGESVILDRSKLEGMDRGVLQDMLDFDDWSTKDEDIIKMNLKAATEQAKSSPGTTVPPQIIKSDNKTVSDIHDNVETQTAEIAATAAANEKSSSSSSTTNNNVSTNTSINNNTINKPNPSDNNQTTQVLQNGQMYALG